MKKIRTFIAVPLSSEVTQTLWATAMVLDKQVSSRSVRWVKPESMHLTLVFLGETAVSQVPQIQTGMDTLAQKQTPFSLTLGQLGCFPNQKQPRIIWAGLQGPLPSVQNLKKAIDEMLLPLGWQPEKRPYNPHLTLGRVRDSQQAQNINWDTPVAEMVIPVQQIDLIESILRPTGPVYTVLHSSRIGL